MNNVGFAFGTLWQQATQAVGYFTQMITGNKAIAAQEKVALDTNYTTRFQSVINGTFGNNGMFVMITIIFIAILASKAYSKK